MKSVFRLKDKITFERIVTPAQFASFAGNVVHLVMATFALAQDAEWTSRQFVLAMKEEHEEGIGTFVHINHHAPAFEGETVLFEAEIEELEGNTINTFFTAKVGERLIASGKTGQRIIPKEKLKQYFEHIKNEHNQG